MNGGKLNKGGRKKIMPKCVTSEHCREISNLIHEVVDYCEPRLKRNPWLAGKLALATKSEEKERPQVKQTSA